MPATNMLSAGAVSMHASGLLHRTIDRRGELMWKFLPENIDRVIVEHPAIEGPFSATEAPDVREIDHPGAISTIAVDPLRIVGTKAEELGEEDAALHLKFLI